MRYDVAIIGAGVAGLSAARALCPTLDVVVLEEEKLPGGLAWQLGCKATDECLYCGVCHGINLKRDLSETSDFCFDYHPGVTILAVRKFGEEFILTREGGEEVETSSILVATGVRPFDARLTSNLGYGTLPGVFTGYDIEKSLNTEGIQRFSTSHRIAFIQCVGSRNFLKKRGYCSQVCCRYALRIAE
ncbi:MAG: FAD-dependent oxidoreductase, partial [Candidatus Atribacteria bacterium]|nr:FAD-dependent oxidoreductase [Candidatus Atribacteria bacterium]